VIPLNGHLRDGFSHGIFQGVLVYPIGMLVNFLSTHLGSAGVAMIITTLIVRTITLPITVKSQMATKSMSELQPKMAVIEEKYRGRDDQQSKMRKNQEIQKMYSELGVNPMSGMLYPFMSLPLFMATWRATSMAASITDPSATFLGFSLGTTPHTAITSGHWQYVIVMVLVGISQFAQFKVTNHLTKQRNKSNKSYISNPKAEGMQKQMGMMTYGFTLVMIFMSFNLQTAMSFYLITSALVSLVQAFYIDKKMKED
jgi:YidC/Oxa1 family membrane protein insertase